MIHFHYCRTFSDNLEKLSSADKEIIHKKLLEYKKRDNLRNIGNIETIGGGEAYVLKIKQPESRVIIQCKEIENFENIYFVRDIITNVKFDREYGRLLYGKIKRGEWLSENPLPEIDIADFKSTYAEHQEAQEDIQEYPPEELISWFNDFELILNNEIFETEEWVAYALRNSIKDGMPDKYVNTFRSTIKDIITCDDGFQLVKEENNIAIFQYEKENIGILFSKISLNDKDFLLLHNGAHIVQQEEYWQECIEKIKNTKIESIPNEETLYRLSFRSYPKWTLNDDELWFRISKTDENSNLSLTTEQVNFLKNFKFPCYINGQAGSGKSTLLYYIFANIIYLKNLESINGEIIFLTENEQLLNDTAQNIFSLLENNPEFKLPIEDIENNNKCFDSFKNFLLNMLDENDLEKFEDDKYLHFPIFKSFYEDSTIKSSIKKEYSAEEAWFVIVTYIYGQDINQKITSETYETEISNKSKKTSIERFKDIEKYVLPFYESLLEKGYWDKLTIIRFIDKNINLDLKPKYSVIICDEAQDFCKVELSFILKQSQYMKYNLSRIEQIPIVFAGDSNQTVNPTGFSDAEMTSLLYQELQEIGFDYDQQSTFYSPNLNYRSTSQVVNLANFIQYYRLKNLGIFLKKPQVSKRPEKDIDKHFNIFLDFKKIESNLELKEDLFKRLEYKVFIIPTDADEKTIYKENSTLLSHYKDLDIKTSVEAKGAEYKQVVLYGFGDYFLDNFHSIDDNNDEFRKRYYFNKLYVAITRAKSELIIIDSPSSAENFWKKLVENQDITNKNDWINLEALKDKNIVYNPDSINNILQSTKKDALENAKEDKKLGEFYQNPSRLKVAASQFFRLGMQEDANACLGAAEEINHNYKAAAEYYKQANELKLTSNAFFRGRYFNDLEKIGSNLQDIDHEMRIVISRIMKNELVLPEEVKNFSKYKSNISTITKDLQWRDELIERLIEFSEKNKKKDFIDGFIEALEYIAKPSDSTLYQKIGDIQFDLKQYKNAAKTWEKIDFYDNEKYYIAKLKYYEEQGDIEFQVIFRNDLTRFEDVKDKKSSYLEILDIHNTNIESFENNSYGNEYHLVIYKALIMTEKFNDALSFGDIVENKVYPSELDARYKEIIEEDYITKEIVSFVLEQWAKFIVKHIDEFGQESLNEVNSKYKTISSKFNIPYKPYTIEEIISSKDELEFHPRGHLTQIVINNFRQFENLILSDIGQFNLIVGDNNIGKTSLLESLLFMDDFNLFYENLAFAYISRNNTNLIKNDSFDMKYELPKDFIYDFFKNNNNHNYLEFELTEGRQQWVYSIKSPTSEEIRQKFSLNASINENEYIALLRDKTTMCIEELAQITKNINPEDVLKMQFIPFGKGFDKTLAKSYYENIDKDKKIRQAFLESMKIFIPKIERITADTDSGTIHIEEEGHDEPFALHQYGEGANKLFRILVQITLQKDKKLLIDEIDAGIHYSHFAEFWKIILKVAKENNVQIFATTHNIECIQYFKELLEDMESYQAASKIITLRRLPNEDIKAYTYNFEAFEQTLNNEFEIRGGAL